MAKFRKRKQPATQPQPVKNPAAPKKSKKASCSECPGAPDVSSCLQPPDPSPTHISSSPSSASSSFSLPSSPTLNMQCGCRILSPRPNFTWDIHKSQPLDISLTPQPAVQTPEFFNMQPGISPTLTAASNSSTYVPVIDPTLTQSSTTAVATMATTATVTVTTTIPPTPEHAGVDILVSDTLESMAGDLEDGRQEEEEELEGDKASDSANDTDKESEWTPANTPYKLMLDIIAWCERLGAETGCWLVLAGSSRAQGSGVLHYIMPPMRQEALPQALSILNTFNKKLLLSQGLVEMEHQKEEAEARQEKAHLQLAASQETIALQAQLIQRLQSGGSAPQADLEIPYLEGKSSVAPGDSQPA
ncbi:hypothetical protein DFH09DRAFT_1074082 [Mycena vulgaris]|nr:hypothetical protein DFH09DRAFT_1074082 [Mycena vulgaris]